MKTRIAQKAIAAAMVVSMVAAPLTAFATTQPSSSGSSDAAVVAAAETTDPGSGTTSAPAVVSTSVAAGGKVSANGATLIATAAGVSTVKSVAGLAITAPADELNAALGVQKGERAFSSSYDITGKTAPASTAAIAEAAASQGGEVVGCWNMNVGVMSAGYKFKLSDGTARVRATAIIPAKANPNLNYKVAVVSPGGSVRVEDDQDQNQKTVTYNANGGLGAYGLIAVP